MKAYTRTAIAIGLTLAFYVGHRVDDVQADFLHWQGGTGDLLDPNWHREGANQPNQTPAPGDELNIGANGDVSFSGTFNAHVFRVGHPFNPDGNLYSGPGTYTQTGGSLTVAHHVALGVERGGTVELSGNAALSVPVGAGIGALHVGFNAGEETTLVVKDNATVTAGFLPIGQFPDAPGIPQTARAFLEIHDNASVTLNNGDRVIIGWFGNSGTGAQAKGKLTMTGGTLSVQPGALAFPDLVVAWDGVGEIEMSDGTMNVANNFVTAIAAADGARPKSQATINHSGGTINAARMFLAQGGDTEYNLSGSGEINVNLRLVLGLFAPGGVQSEAAFTQTGGTVNTNLSSAAAAGVGMLIGERGHGEYNLGGGVLNVNQTLWMGEWETSTAELNITGGVANIGDDLGLSLRGTSAVTQSDGQMNIGRSLLISNGDLSMATSGTYEISGGALGVDVNLVVGVNNGNGRLRVIGGDGTIDVGNDYFQDPNGLLFVQPDAAGLLSTIDVVGDAHFLAGTTLEADFTNSGKTVGDVYDVLTAANIFDNGINFLWTNPQHLPVNYRIVPGGNGQILQVFVIPEPSSLLLLLLSLGLALAACRRRAR